MDNKVEYIYIIIKCGKCNECMITDNKIWRDEYGDEFFEFKCEHCGNNSFIGV